MSKKISKIDIKTGMVYLYTKKVKTVNSSDKSYARITVYNKTLDHCTLDYQRYNNEWIGIYSGTLEECLTKLEKNDNWF